MSAPKHSIFWDYFIDLRSGGPPGYLAHLRVGLDELPHDPDISVWIDRMPKPDPVPSAPPRSLEELQGHIGYFESPDQFDLTEPEFERMMRGGTRSVHLHTSPLALKVSQALKRRGVDDVPVILTSHCPESNGQEMANLYRDAGLAGPLADRFERAVRRIEEMAFKAADVWVFPSADAMEPYRQTIPDFDRWAEGKDIRFVATGALPSARTAGASSAKSLFGLEGHKVVSFIGRHNHVKGYDVFREAALELLKSREDLVVLVAGPPNAALPSPRHERWWELGFHDRPGDVLAASDVFVLPNRMTYFDLVSIEAVAANTPTVASATGGNRTMHDLTDGAISLFDGGPREVVEAVTRLLEEPPHAQLARRQRLATAYETIFAPVRFAGRYVDLIKAIHRDYNIA